jgi:hypothetical protein
VGISLGSACNGPPRHLAGLAKMNAFDLVVTVTLGSSLVTILLSAQVALAEG